MNEYLNVIRRHYVDFSGRARRREYWMFVLVNLVIGLIFTALIGAAGGMGAAAEEGRSMSTTGTLLSGLYGLYGLATLLPSLGVAVRRLHDTGRSGWWILIGVIPLIGSIVQLIFYVQDSMPGSNKWGPNPKTGAALSESAVQANNW